MVKHTVGVTAPGGTVGRHVLRALVQAEHPVTVIARSPDRSVPADLIEKVTVRVADLTDQDRLAAAVRGVDTLLCVIPENPCEDPEEEYRRIADAFAYALANGGVPRAILQSSVGVETDGGGGELRGLRYAERVLADTVASFRVLRCGYFTTNLLPLLPMIVEQGVLPTSMSLDRPMPWVAPRDIAAVEAGLLLSPDWSGCEVRAVHGPRDLTWYQVGDGLARVLGRSVRAFQISDDELRSNLLQSGMPLGSVDSIVETAALMRQPFDMHPPRSVFSTTLTSVEEWVAGAI